MSLQTILWLCTAAWALEAIERYVMYLRGWSGGYGEPATAKRLLISLAIIAACGCYFAIAGSPSADTAFCGALAFAGASVVFGCMPRLRPGEFRYVPGLASTLLLLAPLSIAALWLSVTNPGLTAYGVFSALIFAVVMGVMGLRRSSVTSAASSTPPMPPGPFGD
jgi:hypothetical protein